MFIVLSLHSGLLTLFFPFFSFFGDAMWHVGSQFPNQGLSLLSPELAVWSLIYWTATFQCKECGFPWGAKGTSWGTKIPHTLWPKSQNIQQKQYCNKFNKDFENMLEAYLKLLENVFIKYYASLS